MRVILQVLEYLRGMLPGAAAALDRAAGAVRGTWNHGGYRVLAGIGGPFF